MQIQGLRGQILGLRGQISGLRGLGGVDKWTDKRTKVPCVLQDFVPFGAAALPLIPIYNYAKQGNGYRWPRIALGRPVYVCSHVISTIKHLRGKSRWEKQEEGSREREGDDEPTTKNNLYFQLNAAEQHAA